MNNRPALAYCKMDPFYAAPALANFPSTLHPFATQALANFNSSGNPFYAALVNFTK